jgi:hypothetical protein
MQKLAGSVEGLAKTSKAFDCYERRALSRRKFAFAISTLPKIGRWAPAGVLVF